MSKKKLVFIENDQPVTTSLKVAEVFDKNHQHVMRDIRGLIGQVEDVSKIGQMFQEAEHADKYGRPQPMYLMNRDGFTLLAMGFTGAKALKFKLAYISAFNKMEEKLKALLAEGKDTFWFKTRAQGKLTRKSETSVIKTFIAYAKHQGFTGEDKDIYRQFSIWANIIAGLPLRNGRDNATVRQLNLVDLAENGIKNVLINGMADGIHFTRIIAQVEKWLDDFKKISFVDTYVNSVPLIA